MNIIHRVPQFIEVICDNMKEAVEGTLGFHNLVTLDHYRKDDLIPCRFETLDMSQKGWRAVSERELEDSVKGGKKKTKSKGA